MTEKSMSIESIGRLQNYVESVNARLSELKSVALSDTGMQRNVIEAMWYSLSAGGKRMRPVLMMEFCRMCCSENKIAVDAACALEMIHTFSLIHDDLPCMDNDDFRRGMPSCHKQFGEATALLAGDALENIAFEVICNSCGLGDSVKIKLIRELSSAVGVKGMIGGQVIDTEYEGKAIPEEELLNMYSMKTGALLKAACRMGCIIGNASQKQLEAAESYAQSLGMAFQIIDDVLDIVGESGELGKPIGSDAQKGKITYASLHGVEEASREAERLTENAVTVLKESFDDCDFLCELTCYLSGRKK